MHCRACRSIFPWLAASQSHRSCPGCGAGSSTVSFALMTAASTCFWFKIVDSHVLGYARCVGDEIVTQASQRMNAMIRESIPLWCIARSLFHALFVSSAWLAKRTKKIERHHLTSTTAGATSEQTQQRADRCWRCRSNSIIALLCGKHRVAIAMSRAEFWSLEALPKQNRSCQGRELYQTPQSPGLSACVEQIPRGGA